MVNLLKTAIPGILLAGIGFACSPANAQTAPTPSKDGAAAVHQAPSSVGTAARPADDGGMRPHHISRTGAPSMVVVPAMDASRTAQNPQDGCWVRLMDNVDKVKGNEYLMIFGSKYMPDLKTARGEDWAQKMDGINIGPNALVTVFGEPGYGGRGVVLRPNQVVQDFHKDLGFVNAVESMKVDCRA